jgi:hypothetical protein
VTAREGPGPPGYPLRDGPAGDDPSHGLAGDLRDQVVIGVIVQHSDVFPFRDGSESGSPTDRIFPLRNSSA